MAATTKKESARHRWYYSYGLFNVAVTSSDYLMVIFAALALGASAIAVGEIDAIGYLGPVAAYILWGRIVDRVHSQRKIVVLTFVLTAVPLFLLALTRNFQALFVLTLLWGFVMVAPMTSSSVLITRLFHRQDWAREYSLFNSITTFGSISGLLIAIIWLAIMDSMGKEVPGMRLWFVIAGTIVIMAAFAASRLVREPEVVSHAPPRSGSRRQMTLWLRPRLWLRILFVLYHRAGGALKNLRGVGLFGVERYPDQLINHYVTASIMFLGFGMASTALILYLSRGLGVSSATILMVVMVFLIASYLSYRYVGQLVSELSPVRAIFIGSVLRAGVFATMGIVGGLFSSSVAIVLIGVLNAFSGVCWAAIAVGGLTRTADLAPLHRRGEAMGVYNAIANGAALAGALVAGVLAQFLGYTAVFLICALVVMFSAWAYLKL